MIDLRSIVGLLAGALVATAACAGEAATPKAAEPAKAKKQAAAQKAPPARSIDIRRDAKEAWSEMRRIGPEVREGVPAAGRDARDTFKSGWNKTKDGFTGKAPPTIPDPPK